MRQTMTSSPNVGDVIYYVGYGFKFLTHDTGYLVIGVDDDGDVIIKDDDGDDEYIRHERFRNFEVEGEVFENPGFIEVIEVEDEDYPEDGVYVMRVAVTTEGEKSIRKMEEQHKRATSREAIVKQIETLQAELKKL